MVKMDEITSKNTKAEILKALNEALDREKLAKSTKSDPVAQEKKKVEKAVVESTRAAVSLNVFSDELIKKFNDLEQAIKIEEDKLTELYGIGKELQNMTVVINAGKDALLKIEDEKRLKTEALQKSIQELKDSYDQKNNELKSEYDTRAKALKTEREREAEEYTYNLKRTRAIEENEWQDEKARRELALAESEQKAKAILDDVQSKASYIRELEEKVDGIADLVEKEKKTAVEAAVDGLKRELEYKASIAEKDYTNTIARLEYKAETLSQEIEKSNAMASALQTKLDKAYSEIRDLATKTVEATGGVKFISNTASDK